MQTFDVLGNVMSLVRTLVCWANHAVHGTATSVCDCIQALLEEKAHLLPGIELPVSPSYTAVNMRSRTSACCHAFSVCTSISCAHPLHGALACLLVRVVTSCCYVV